MDENNGILRNRIEKIWEQADFSTFFQQILQKPIQNIKKGKLLFSEGDQLEKLYFIKTGFVKLYRLSEKGKESTIYLFGPGHLLGIRALLSKDKRARHNAETITDVQIISILRGEFFEAIATHPEYLVDFVHLVIYRLNYTERKLEGFILTDATARVANFLNDCALRFGKEENGHILLPFRLTHQRIAEFVGSFRETVTLAINKLEKEGILTMKKGEIVIKDPKKLKLNPYVQTYSTPEVK